MIKTLSSETIHFAIAEKIKNGTSYIEAICDYAIEQNLEIETVALVVKKSEVLKEKLRDEALKLNLVKKDPSVNNLFE